VNAIFRSVFEEKKHKKKNPKQSSDCATDSMGWGKVLLVTPQAFVPAFLQLLQPSLHVPSRSSDSQRGCWRMEIMTIKMLWGLEIY